MATATCTRTRAPKVTVSTVDALLTEGGGYLVQDADGLVYCLPRLSAAQADDPDLLVLADYADVAGAVRRAGGSPGAARAITAMYANAHTRGLLS